MGGTELLRRRNNHSRRHELHQRQWLTNSEQQRLRSRNARACYETGGGYEFSCGNIVIDGGTITAVGGDWAADIGGGYGAFCGNITIKDNVTKVTATKGNYAKHSIGTGGLGSCGTVTIGGNVGPIE